MSFNHTILYMPVDIPKFHMKQELIADFHKEFTPHTAQAFESQRLLKTTKNYATSEPRDDLTESQTAVIDYVNKYLPFSDLINVKLHHMRRQGSIHIDMVEPEANPELYQHNKENEPCGYRMVIQGSRHGDLAVITDDQVIKMPVLPEDTDWYNISHTGTPHGNTRYVDDRYILFCHGRMDIEKQKALVKQSYNKYKDVPGAIVYRQEHTYTDDWKSEDAS